MLQLLNNFRTNGNFDILKLYSQQSIINSVLLRQQDAERTLFSVAQHHAQYPTEKFKMSKKQLNQLTHYSQQLQRALLHAAQVYGRTSVELARLLAKLASVRQKLLNLAKLSTTILTQETIFPSAFMNDNAFEHYVMGHCNYLDKGKISAIISLYRSSRNSRLFEFEQKNINKIYDIVDFDGYYYSVQKPLMIEVNFDGITVPPTEGEMQFDSASDDDLTYHFNFSNEVSDWDEQDLKFKSVRLAMRKLGQGALLNMLTKARPVGNAVFASCIYFAFMQVDRPKEFLYLEQCGFFKPSTDVWNYIDECKKFTKFVKYKQSAFVRAGFLPEVLKELENMAGFRYTDREIDWNSEIGTWVSSKKNMNTASAAVSAYQTCQYRFDLTKLKWAEFDSTVVYSAKTYNSTGSAKFEHIDTGELKKRGFTQSKKLPASKTAFNLKTNWQTRLALLNDTSTLFGYPIVKKEVTKVRYIVNTDLKSHYKMAPLEKIMLAASVNGIYNAATKDQIAAFTKRLMKNDDRHRVCMDQSSFDHYTSAYSFVHLLSFFLNAMPTQGVHYRTVLQGLLTTFKQQNICVADAKNLSFWQSGMLSGWKITSLGDSTINLMQTDYCLSVMGVSKYEYEIYVMGDDVVMLTELDIASKLTTVMNDLGLVQHPDKTMSSTKSAEFLRQLYNAEDQSVRGYPARLIPSLAFMKPWISSYEQIEGDLGGMIAMVSNWKRLMNRVMSTNALSAFAAVDVMMATRNYGAYNKYREFFRSAAVVLTLQPTFASDAESRFLNKQPHRYNIHDGNLTDADLQRWVALQKSSNYKARLKAIKADDEQKEDFLQYVKKGKKLKLLASPPLPQSWLKELSNKLQAAKFVRLCNMWGQMKETATAVQMRQMHMQERNADFFVRLWRRQQALKNNSIYLSDVPDTLTSDLKDELKMNAIMAFNTTEEMLESYSSQVLRINWRDYVYFRSNIKIAAI